jgi:hypothetical protein
VSVGRDTPQHCSVLSSGFFDFLLPNDESGAALSLNVTGRGQPRRFVQVRLQDSGSSVMKGPRLAMVPILCP